MRSFCAAFLLWMSSTAFGDVTFRVADLEASPGGTVTGSVIMDSTEILQGFAYGLCPDELFVVSVLAVDAGAALAAFGSGSGPDFFQADLDPEGFGWGGHTVGCVLDFDGVEVLGAFPDQELVEFTLDASDVDSLELCFCEWLGEPDVSTIYLVAGASVAPATECGSIALGELFDRGDCNEDGSYDIGDAITVLDLLFSGGSVECDSACDANDDGAVDIGDGIFALSSLFSGGANPVAPFGSCGADPTADALGCGSFSACP